MRGQFVETVGRLLATDPRVVVLLGDIGVFGFRHAFAAYPDRVYNVGILEQATIGLAAGLARAGMIPIVHTIAPFLVERGLEQIKIDFGYQRLGGVFVSVGASFDYAALGCTHHCPADVPTLLAVPELDVFVPGHAAEFDAILGSHYGSGRASYIRLSEVQNQEMVAPEVGRAVMAKPGRRALVLAVGPMLAVALEAAEGLDVGVLYLSSLEPFDRTALNEHAMSGRILVCEPYQSGALASRIVEALWPRPVLIRHVGVPREFLRSYGTRAEHAEALGWTRKGVRRQLETLLDA